MGAGLIEMAIIIAGGIVASKTLKLGGFHMDMVIKNYLHLKNGIIIGENTAEKLKDDLMQFSDTKNISDVQICMILFGS